jgi:hypothetical protein
MTFQLSPEETREVVHRFDWNGKEPKTAEVALL